ncbi:MAG TPA: tetratricopeptide repeat protein [Myxococcota bacterium]
MPEKSNPHHGATEVLEDLGSGIERMATWVAAHPILVSAVIGVVLATGGAWELLRSRAERRAGEASDALDQTQMAYLAAMGAEPGAIDLPELANPEAARQIREEYLEKFRGVAEAHPGTLPAALAWLEVADLQQKQGDADAGLESLRNALAEQPTNPRIAGLVHQRIAQALEDRGELAQAAAEHEAAGDLAGFPLRYYALADAARCYAQAGQPERALSLLERVESEAQEEAPLPADLRGLLRELRASQAARPSPADTSDKNDSVK